MNDAKYLWKPRLSGVLHTAKCSRGVDKASEPTTGSVESLQHILLTQRFAAIHQRWSEGLGALQISSLFLIYVTLI